jgi:catalase
LSRDALQAFDNLFGLQPGYRPVHAEPVHTDIIAHSVDAFPTRTAEEFVEFLRAIGASGPSAPKPTPIESFLATRPAALAFVQAPKPIPTSFAKGIVLLR